MLKRAIAIEMPESGSSWRAAVGREYASAATGQIRRWRDEIDLWKPADSFAGAGFVMLSTIR
jgi:hypothetical protein